MPSEKPIRLGVVGFGPRGRAMAEMCRALPTVDWVAACDTDPAAEARARALRADVTFHTDYRRLFDSGTINTVIIESWPAAHAECAIAALERGIHVFSDVPAVHTLDEAPRLFAAAERSRALYMFGENVNYWAFIEAGLDLKRKGLLGEPVYLEAEYVHEISDLADRTPWRRNYEPIRYCTHSLGPILKWVGEELISVSCFDTGGRRSGDPAAHDAMVAIFRTASNVVVKVLCTFVNRHPQHFHRYVYYGTKGYFERSAPLAGGKQDVLMYSTEIPGLEGLTSLPIGYAIPGRGAGGHGGADRAMMEDFFAAIVNGRPSPIGVRDALRMTLPGLYALESARRGGELVPIEYPWTAGPASFSPAKAGAAG